VGSEQWAVGHGRPLVPRLGAGLAFSRERTASEAR